ncbi:MAG: hypothetical protein K6D38_09670 [Pseudobutyrivibrio sp.]|nr:hypothetical protein [Pseudobutyrivibrio sp.]
MALEFERNINLEEIDSDALFGISYLEHQTIAQKVIFFGCAGVSVAMFVATNFIFEVPFVIPLILEIIIGGLGFLFGANQCEYLSIAQYLKLLFFKPIKYANYASSEDIEWMKGAVEHTKVEAAKREKEMAEATPEGQRRLLIIVVAIILGSAIIGLTLVGIGSSKENEIGHHTVEYVIEK